MRLVAFDLETTGLDPGRCAVLQVGAAVFESTTGEIIDTFEELVTPVHYDGDPFALAMNSAILYRIAKEKPEGLAYVKESLHTWLLLNGVIRPHAVGFNVGSFDLQFGFKDLFHHRSVELGTFLMGNFSKDIPVTSTEWHKFQNREVAHTALDDCLEAVEAYMYGRS